MAAYVVVSVRVRDRERYEEYKQLVPASLAAFDGRFIVRGGKVEALEGEWLLERFVILEFPSAERAKEWWSSEEYKEAKALRQATSDAQMILVEGV